jgi:hypothetical protein
VDSVAVLARFDESGNVQPLRFTWQGVEYPVEASGRRWKDEAGLHILVMSAGGRVFELLWSADQAVWSLRQIGPPRPGVV